MTMTDEAHELDLYISNTQPVWAIVEAAARNYERKRAKGTYNSALAVKGLAYAVEAGAKSYCKEHCAPSEKWHVIFVPSVRHEVAHSIARHLESEWACGNFWTLEKVA